VNVLVVRNQDIVPLGTLTAPVESRGGRVTTWWPGHEPAPDLEGADAVIVLGGGANPDEDDRYPWLEGERRLLREAVDEGVPVLGICLGAQLLAQALGGSAYPLAAPVIGWRPVAAERAASGDPLATAWAVLSRAFAWHGHAFDLPPGAELLAGDPAAVEAFRFGECAWGIQYHVEVDADIVACWLRGYDDEVRGRGIHPPAVLAETRRHMDGCRRHSRALAGAFLAVARHRLRHPTGGAA
jgi:GMP synthase (glutamine-hydrolysing)